MIAGKILESQIWPLAAHSVEEHRGPEGSVCPSVFVVDGEERPEAIGAILLQAREWEVQLMDESVTELVAKNELIAPHIQDVSTEVLLRDGPGLTLAGDNLWEEFRKNVVGSLSKRPRARRSFGRLAQLLRSRSLWEVCR